jgi:hypothetical protein
VTVNDRDDTGVLLASFFLDGDNEDSVGDTLVSGDLTNVGNASDGTPNLFREEEDRGLNLFSWSTDVFVDFTAGTQAFIGSATWTVDAATYADMLASNTSGNLYFPAEDSSGISGAVLLGQWSVVPAPGSMVLLGLGGIVAGRRRR